ncbi:hypothetical protein V9T40_006304 [Parthenolecanium corni]|uniref:L-dopachrome isomerase n=1 Tax=Parthenolecanium corni TaxID=536013 RepID=A0AAN9Y5F1_9HEMI
MPRFQLQTNVSESKITPEFLKSTVQVVADMLGRSKEQVSVHVQGDQKICIGDTDGLSGIATLKSFGPHSDKDNKKYSIAICGHLNKTLGIPPNRVKIHFMAVTPSEIGTNNTTLHYILGGKD